MSSFNIIIQSTKTERGLEVEYNTFNPTENILELKNTLDDERDIPSKANDKDAFSVQISDSYKIYSLVFGIADFFGRPGCVTIRLYCPKNSMVSNFESILNQIKSRYESYLTLKSQEANDFKEILSRIVTPSSNQNIVSLTKSGKYFCYYDLDNSELEQTFNSDLIYLAEKLYAFQRPKEEQIEIAGLKYIKSLENCLFNTQIIEGELSLISEIKICKQKVEFDKRKNRVVILLRENETMSHVVSTKAETQKFGNCIKVSEKHFPPKVITPKKSPWEFVLGCLLGIAIGFAVCYFVFPQVIYRDNEVEISGEPNVLSSDSIVFTNTSGVFKTTNPIFKDYSFKYSNCNWSFKSDQNDKNYSDFYISTLDSLKNQGAALSKKTKEEFLRELKKISGYDIKNRERQPVSKPAEVKNSNTTPKKPTEPEKAEVKKVKKPISEEKQKNKPSNEVGMELPGKNKNQ